MSNLQITTHLLTLSTAESILTIISTLIGVLTTFLKLTSKLLNHPSKDHEEIFKKANISNLARKIFLIKISLKNIPKVTNIDKVFSFLLVAILLVAFISFGHFNISLWKVPKDWNALTLKSTQESFLMTYNKATSHSLYNKNKWFIDTEVCKQVKTEVIAKQRGISDNLANVICEILTNPTENLKLEKSINNLNKQKHFLYPALSFFEIVMLGIIANILLTLKYKKTLRKYILIEQEKAASFVK